MSWQTKTFSVQEEISRQTITLDLTLDLRAATVDLSPLLSTLCPPPAQDVSIYDPTLHTYLPLSRIGD